MSYLQESIPADTEAVNLGASRIRALKVDLDALIEQIFEDAGTFLPGWITAGGATGSTSLFAAGAIQSADIGAGQVLTANLGNAAVTLAQLAAQSVDVTKFVNGIVMPTNSVNTAALQAGALAATTQGQAIMADGYILPSKLGFSVAQAVIGTYTGSNSSSAQVNTLAFEPDMVILTGGTLDGIGISFRAEATGGGPSSPIRRSFENTAIVSPFIVGVQWIAPSGGGGNGGFTVVPNGVFCNASGNTHTYVAFKF